ncbi:hypothetical protein CIB84_000106, partial [Bambusicola thoracicus]
MKVKHELQCNLLTPVSISEVEKHTSSKVFCVVPYYRVMEKCDIFLYCDIHGHNKKQNVFLCGCEREQEPKAPHLHPRAFPLLLSKNCPDKVSKLQILMVYPSCKFSFPDCCFRVQKSKESTGRVVMWKMGINNSYTLEASVCGSELGWRQSTHFDIKDLESIGQHFCDALWNYSVDNKE